MIEPVARVRIELQDLEPKIWRRVDLPLSSTLAVLHEIIQITMGWLDYHLHQFEIGGRCYGVPHPDDADFGMKIYKSSVLRMKSIIDRGFDRFVYLYDFGDDWRHDIIIEGVRDGDADTDYPAYVDGAGCCPPEDVGGTYGFMEFLEAVMDPLHEEHDRLVEWYGGPFDPNAIDEERSRMWLRVLADRRLGPLNRHHGTSMKAKGPQIKYADPRMLPRIGPTWSD